MDIPKQIKADVALEFIRMGNLCDALSEDLLDDDALIEDILNDTAEEPLTSDSKITPRTLKDIVLARIVEEGTF